MMRRSLRTPPILRSTVVFGALERVEHHRAQTGDVAVIARHQCQAIGQRSRCEQAIDSREGPDGAHTTPLIGYRVIDAEHAPIECRLYFPQPAFERHQAPPGYRWPARSD